MNKYWKLTLGAAALAVSMGAQATTIDLFSTNQAKLIDGTTGDGGLSSSVVGANILGTERDLYVELLTQNAANPTATADIGVAGGALSFSVDSLATGTGTVQWDGVDGSNTLNTTGLGGVDLTADGSIQFEVTTLFSDLGYRFDIGAYTDATHWTVISFLAHSVSSSTISYIPFAGFTNAGLCGFDDPTGTTPGAEGVTHIACGAGGVVDFTNLGALELLIDPLGGTTSIDLTLDSVRTVPEPGVLALLGVGLLALGLGSRRRNNLA